MRDYLDEASEVIRAPRPLRELLSENHSAAMQALLKCLRSSNIMVRKYTAFAMGQIGDTDILDDLQAAYDGEPKGGARDAMGAALVALRSAPRETASEHIRAMAVTNVYEGRPWDSGLEEAIAADQVPMPKDYLQRVQAELRSSPPVFRAGFAQLSNGQLDEAASTFCGCAIAGGDGMTDQWAATACCYAAYCVAELGDYQQALDMADLGKKMGFLLNGAYYYYSAMFKALNQLDKLEEALRIAEEAIQFFSDQGSTGDVASHLGGKANILKQMASHLSRSSQPQRARPVIIDAIKSYCESLAITTVGFGDVDTEGLAAMGTIAARVGVSRSDLTFLSKMPRVDSLVSRFVPR